ncbi:hypothetical protein [Sporomusa sphaeroides]|nr:hypothetical protein [Sporomusa sphaeroides]
MAKKNSKNWIARNATAIALSDVLWHRMASHCVMVNAPNAEEKGR